MTLIEFLTLICKSKRFFTYNVTILCGFVTIVLSERAIDRITNFTSNYERVAIKNRNHYENLYKTTLSIFRLFVIIINNLEVFKREFPDFKIISNIFEIEYFQDELFMKLYFDDILLLTILLLVRLLITKAIINLVLKKLSWKKF